MTAMESEPRVNILLVDDQPGKLTSYEVILGELGENLIKASSGDEALRHLLQTEVAVVLMDVCMPGLDGFELAQMIRQHPRLEKTAIILVSAVFMTDLDRLKGYHSGAVDYVPVPIIPEVLRAKVRVFADLYRKSAQLRSFNSDLEQRVQLRTAALAASSESLRKSEERFRFLAETIPSMVWITSTDGKLTYANRRWLEYRGLEAEPESPWPDGELHPDDRDAWLTEWSKHLARGERFEIEARHRRHDGVYRWFLTRAAPRRTEAGEIVCWFGVTTDIHEQKAMQQQLLDADRRKDDFLAVLSHELRNPLAPIVNAVRTMRARAIADPDLAWCRDVIERQTDSLTQLVDELLDVSRISSGKVRLQREVVDIATIVDAAVETNRPLIDARRHQLVVERPDHPVCVDGDPTRLGQVFGNLINNSAKYTDVGGCITVRIEVDPSPNGDGELAVVRVVDNGLGISPEMLPHVFQPFTQGELTIDRAQGGLGIGLSLVRSLVQLHGGTAHARSDGFGCGSEFVVRLPRVATPAPAVSATPSPAPKPEIHPTPRRILVVDDNVDSAESLALLLRCFGHDVATASDGRSALAVAATMRPEVVLLDLGMPEMSGYETAKALRRETWARDIVLIAQTGWGMEEDRRRTTESGFDLHLTKPLDGEALIQLLAEFPKSDAASPLPRAMPPDGATRGGERTNCAEAEE
jgi:two-component system CheB/CheR fusion protein